MPTLLRNIRRFLFNNESARQTIYKNTVWLSVSNIAARLIRAILIIYAARILGVGEWGVFAYALSIAAFFTIFTDFGINAVITREASRDISLQRKYFATALGIKVVVFVCIAALAILVTPFFVKNEAVVMLIPYVVLIIGFDSLRDLALSLPRAAERMEVEAFVQVATNVLIVICGFTALAFSRTAASLALGYGIGTALGMLVAFYPFRAYLKRLREHIHRDLVRPILAASWPLGMLIVMGTLMFNTDILMIGWFRSIEDVGLYSAVQRITQLLYAVPALVSSAVFPPMARLASDKERFRKLVEKALIAMIFIGVPLSVVTVTLSKSLVGLLYGAEYLPATTSFAVMNLTYIPVYMTAVLSNTLFALNKERKLVTYVIMGVLGNFLLNLLFIPWWGAAGAAISTVTNQALLMLYMWHKVRREVPITIVGRLLKILLAAFAMLAVTVVAMWFELNAYVTIVCAGILYLALLYALKDSTLMEVKGTLTHALK